MPLSKTAINFNCVLEDLAPLINAHHPDWIVCTGLPWLPRVLRGGLLPLLQLRALSQEGASLLPLCI